MAIDGVVSDFERQKPRSFFFPVQTNQLCFYLRQAPRAKMNQQRSRRFRASKEGVELVEEKNRMREEVIQRGVCVMFFKSRHCWIAHTEYVCRLCDSKRYTTAR